MSDMITLGKMIGNDLIDDFEEFDLTLIQKILSSLSVEDAIDIAHAEMLQRKSLYAAEIIIEYIAKLVKTVSYLETKSNSVKNKISLEYKSPDGKTTADMKKQAGESSPEAEQFLLKLARAKGAKTFLERKYDILLKSHYYFKEISNNQKKEIMAGNGSKGWMQNE